MSAINDRTMADVSRPGGILAIHGLHKWFSTSNDKVSHVLRGVEMTVQPREIVALVGESGSGKSTLARTMVRLYTPEEGTMTFDGIDVTHIMGRELSKYRQHVQMLFQDPFASLNPTHPVATILMRNISSASHAVRKREKLDRAREALERVGLTPPENFLRQYPHELSGGQRQRVAMARSILSQPTLVVTDEPVSMLDVSLRLGVLNLMLELNEEQGLGYVYITHDLASARYLATRILVMYAGEIVEEGRTEDIVQRPQHPYTQLLMEAAPDPERETQTMDQVAFAGEPPDLSLDIVGCPFQFRCGYVHTTCQTTLPTMGEIETDHFVKCHLFSETKE